LKKKEQQVLEEKQKRETNEQVTLETTAEAELLKTKLIDSQLEKERLEATSRKLANSIENMKEDITQQEESKEKDLHDLDKKHKDELRKLQIQSDKEVKGLEHKKESYFRST